MMEVGETIEGKADSSGEEERKWGGGQWKA
jgi:hypothetical protein